MRVHKVSPEDWKPLSELAHSAVFKEHKPSDWDRIDFVLTVEEDDGKPRGYVTCRELDAKTLYWQFGGAFPDTQNSIAAFRGYQNFARWSKDRYDRVCTYIENTNSPMLKMAAKIGFVIVGVRNFKGSVLLEHLLEFSEVN